MLAVMLLPASMVIAPAAAFPVAPISIVELLSTRMPGLRVEYDQAGGAFRTRPPSCTDPPFTAATFPLRPLPGADLPTPSYPPPAAAVRIPVATSFEPAPSATTRPLCSVIAPVTVSVPPAVTATRKLSWLTSGVALGSVPAVPTLNVLPMVTTPPAFLCHGSSSIAQPAVGLSILMRQALRHIVR